MKIYNVRILDIDPINCEDEGNLLHMHNLTENEFRNLLSMARKNNLRIIIDTILPSGAEVGDANRQSRSQQEEGDYN